MDLNQNCSKNFDISKNMAARGGASFPYMAILKLKKSSSPKLLVQFQINFTWMILWWISTKIVQRISISQKTWPPGAGQFSLYGYIENLEKSSSPKLLVRLQINFTGMILAWTSTKIVQRILISQKTWLPGIGPVFLIWLYWKLKSSSIKLLVQLQKQFTEIIFWETSSKLV